MATNYLQKLFHDTLNDIYYAEKKILTALPKMAEATLLRNMKRKHRPTSSVWKRSFR